MEISNDQFETWVKEAIDSLPERFLKHIHNLAVFVEDYPTREQMKKAGLGHNQLLLGLYEGYHQAMKLDVGPVLPDRITIFRNNILRLCSSQEEVRDQVIRTVRHEIAHHFGSGEKGAREAGKRR